MKTIYKFSAILLGITLAVFTACKTDVIVDSGKVTGSAVFTNAESSEGIIISLESNSGSGTTASVTTKSDGTYVFDKIPVGDYTLFAECEDSVENKVYLDVRVAKDETTKVDSISFTATGTVSGNIVLDETEKDNAGFLVFLAGTGCLAMTDDAGNYTIKGVPAGDKYSIFISKNNLLYELTGTVSVEAKKTTTVAAVKFSSSDLVAQDGKDGTDGKDGKDGTDGKDGKDGSDAISIKWLGSFDSEEDIEKPAELNAYYNTTDGCSYIYDGTEWTILTKGAYALQEELSVTLRASTYEETSSDITIYATVAGNDIARVAYRRSDYSSYSAADVLTYYGTTLESYAEGLYSFEVTQNGIYSVAVGDSVGNSTVTSISINNIDKTAPAAASSINYSFNSATGSLVLRWNNPSDKDFDHMLLGYTKDGEEIVSNEALSSSTRTYTVNGAAAGEEYVFTLKAVDSNGNVGAATSKTATLTAGFSIDSIELDRYHIYSGDTNRIINITASLSNVTAEDDIRFIISGNGTNTSGRADIDVSTGLATYAYELPTFYVNDSSGIDYVVSCSKNGEADDNHSIRFNVCPAPNIYEFLIADNWNNKLEINKTEISEGTTIRVFLRGYNLDVGNIVFQLYNSKGEAYLDDPIPLNLGINEWTATTGSYYSEYYTEIPVPVISEYYTVKAIVNGNINYRESVIYVYSTPEFSSFEIPTVSCSVAGNKVTATVKGKDFNSPEASAAGYSAVCSEDPSIVDSVSFKNITYNKMEMEFTIPSTVGTYPITLKFGSEEITANLVVKDYSAYSNGDLLLGDGTIIPYSSEYEYSDEEKENAVGLLVINDYGSPSCWVGFYTGYRRQMMKESSVAYNADLSELSYNVTNNVVTGDIYGYDNWNYICSIDPEGTSDAVVADNYPAYAWINNYGNNYNLPDSCNNGWYIPSYMELYKVLKNYSLYNQLFSRIKEMYIYDNYTVYMTSNFASYYSDHIENGYRFISLNNGGFNNIGITLATDNAYILPFFPFTDPEE